MEAFYDPPYALQSGNGLMPVTASPDDIITATAAQPGHSPPPATAMQTSIAEMTTGGVFQIGPLSSSTDKPLAGPPVSSDESSASVLDGLSLEGEPLTWPISDSSPSVGSPTQGRVPSIQSLDDPAVPPSQSSSTDEVPAGPPANSNEPSSSDSSNLPPGVGLITHSAFNPLPLSISPAQDPSTQSLDVPTVTDSVPTQDVGDPPAVDSQPFSSGTAFPEVVPTITYDIASMDISTASGVPQDLVVGPWIITAGPSSTYLVAGRTLVPGGPAVTISGTTISLDSSGHYIVACGATMVPVDPSSAYVFSLRSSTYTYTMKAASGIMLGSNTMIPGAVVTVGGDVLSLAPSELL
jgi:hypothetical protein